MTGEIAPGHDAAPEHAARPAPAPSTRSGPLAGLARLAANPVLEQEKLRRARSWRTPLALAAAVASLGCFAVALFAFALSRAPDARPNAVEMARVAHLTAGLQLLLVLLLVPAAAARTVAGQRRSGALDLLRLGRFSAGDLVTGGMAAALAFPTLVIVAAVPVLVAVFLYAGLDLGQLALVELLTLASAAALAAVASLAGATAERAVTAVLVTYLAGAALYGATLLLGLVVHYDVALGPERATGSAVHPLVFANPFYALHAALLGPSPAGAHVGQLLGLLVTDPLRPSTWGPVVQPWLASLLAQAGLAAAAGGGAVRLVGRRGAPRSRPNPLTWFRQTFRPGRSVAAALLVAVAIAGAATIASRPAAGQPAPPPGPTGPASTVNETGPAAAPNETRPGGLSVAAAPRWGRSSPGAWTAYLVTARNDGPGAFEGEVVLSPRAAPRPGQEVADAPQAAPAGARQQVVGLGQRELTLARSTAPTREPGDFPLHRAPMALDSGGTEKRLTMVVVEAPYGYEAELRDGAGRKVATSPAFAGPQPLRTVAVMSNDARAVDGVGRLRDRSELGSLAVTAGGSLAVTAVSSPRDAPDTAVGYAGLDAVVVAGSGAAGLGSPQLRALRDFVALGGGLVLAGRPAAAWAGGALPAELVPLRPSGTTEAPLGALTALVEQPTAATAAVATGERRGRSLLDAGDGLPLVMTLEHRGGRVVQLTYDPLEEPFASDPVLADLGWQQGVARALAGTEVRYAEQAALAPSEQLWSPVADVLGWAPWPRSGLWQLVIYTLVVLPLTYVAVRLLRRARRYWVAVPALAALFAVLAAGAGQARRSTERPVLRVSALGPAGTALTNTYEELEVVGRRLGRIEAGDASVSTLFTGPRLLGADPDLAGTGGGEVVSSGAGAELRLEPGRVRNSQRMDVADRPGLESRLALVGTDPPEEGGLRVTGSITNRSTVPMHRLRVQLPEGAQARVAERVRPGETRAVDATFVWPGRIEAGSGFASPPEELVMFAAADRAFPRAGRVVVVGLQARDEGGGGPGGLAVVTAVVALETTSSPLAGTGRAYPVAGLGESEAKVGFEIDGLGGLGPVALQYGTHAPPPEVYDWATESWRQLPPGDRGRGLVDSQPLATTELRDGVVHLRARLSQTTTGFGLVANRPENRTRRTNQEAAR